MNLTSELKSYLSDLGADLVGISPAEAMQNAPEGHRPTDFMPKAKSVVSIGYELNRGPVFGLPKTRNEYVLEFEQANHTLNTLAHRGVRYLEKKGCLSIAVPATASIGDGARLAGDISHKHAAAAAGLGVFGLNNLLITPQYGNRLRLATIVTEAELEPGVPMDESPCNNCGKCVRNCPANALDGAEELNNPQQGWRINKEKCYHYIFVQLGGKRCGMCIASCPISAKV